MYASTGPLDPGRDDEITSEWRRRRRADPRPDSGLHCDRLDAGASARREVAMPTPPNSTRTRANENKGDVAVSYNEFKEYEGQRYSGMKIGRSHKWYYDPGEWREK